MDSATEYGNMCEATIAKRNPAMILCVLARNSPDR